VDLGKDSTGLARTPPKSTAAALRKVEDFMLLNE